MTRRTVRVVFERVQYRANKQAKCGCGTMRARTKVFSQTLSPMNRNVDGTLKTAAQARVELADEAAAWKLEPIVCYVCERKALKS